MRTEFRLVVDGDTLEIDTSSGLGLEMDTPEGRILIVGQPHTVEYVQDAILKKRQYEA